MSLNDFYVGQEVSFITNTTTIPCYFAPSKLTEEGFSVIKHGMMTFKENKGTVMYVGKNHIFVEYIDINGRQVCLGFLPDKLETNNN